MSNCVVCLKFSEKPGRPRLDGVDLGIQVVDFKQRVSTVMDIPSTDFSLVYCGKQMKDSDSLSACGVKTGCTVHIMRKRLPEPEIRPEPLDDTGIRQLLNALHAALLNPAHRQAVHKILTSPETIDNIIAATPGMATDHIAMSMLRDPQLLVQVADPDNVRRIVKAHPAIGHAVMHIAASVTEEAALSSRGGALGQDLPLDPSFFPDLTSDEEMETGEGGASTSQGTGGQRSRGGQGGITTAQLTAALAAAGVGRQGGAGMIMRPFEGPVSGTDRPSGSSSGQRSSDAAATAVGGGQPGVSPAPQTASTAGSSRSSSSTPQQAQPGGGGVAGGGSVVGAGGQVITADIFRQAMSQALQVSQRIRGGMGAGGPGDAPTSPATASQAPAQNFESQMQQLRDMGLIDDATNLRALQATGGDLQAALHLILEGRM